MFTITNKLNGVAQLQLSSCKSGQYLFKCQINKNHHNHLQKHIESISTSRLSNHQSSKIFLNIRSIVATTWGCAEVWRYPGPCASAEIFPGGNITFFQVADDAMPMDRIACQQCLRSTVTCGKTPTTQVASLSSPKTARPSHKKVK